MPEPEMPKPEMVEKIVGDNMESRSANRLAVHGWRPVHGWRLPLLSLLLLVVAGCGGSPVLKLARESNDAAADLADALESVVDEKTALAVTDTLGAKYDRIIDLTGKLPAWAKKYGHTKPPQAEMSRVMEDQRSIIARNKKTDERLGSTQGLPVEFWNIVRLKSHELLIVALESGDAIAPGTADRAVIQFFRDCYDLLKNNSPEKIVEVEFKNLSRATAQRAYDCLIAAADENAKHYVYDGPNGHLLVMGPVSDFDGMVATIDIGSVTFKDKARGALRITVDRRKLEARAFVKTEEQRLRAAAGRREHDQRMAEFDAEFDADLDAESAKRAAERKAKEVPARDDPKFFERIATLLETGGPFKKIDAARAILSVKPSEAPSPEVRKRIAVALRSLATDEFGSSQAIAIRGLVTWAGKYSVPTLIEIMDRSGHREVYSALAKLKTKEAAASVAAQLGDFTKHRQAVACLLKMGPVAEDALIETVPSNNEEACLAAIEILGKVGSKKSAKILRQAITESRNPVVRETAKAAIRKITARANAAG